MAGDYIPLETLAEETFNLNQDTYGNLVDKAGEFDRWMKNVRNTVLLKGNKREYKEQNIGHFVEILDTMLDVGRQTKQLLTKNFDGQSNDYFEVPYKELPKKLAERLMTNAAEPFGVLRQLSLEQRKELLGAFADIIRLYNAELNEDATPLDEVVYIVAEAALDSATDYNTANARRFSMTPHNALLFYAQTSASMFRLSRAIDYLVLREDMEEHIAKYDEGFIKDVYTCVATMIAQDKRIQKKSKGDKEGNFGQRLRFMFEDRTTRAVVQEAMGYAFNPVNPEAGWQEIYNLTFAKEPAAELNFRLPGRLGDLQDSIASVGKSAKNVVTPLVGRLSFLVDNAIVNKVSTWYSGTAMGKKLAGFSNELKKELYFIQQVAAYSAGRAEYIERLWAKGQVPIVDVPLPGVDAIEVISAPQRTKNTELLKKHSALTPSAAEEPAVEEPPAEEPAAEEESSTFDEEDYQFR